jgi:hypothetical protein
MLWRPVCRRQFSLQRQYGGQSRGMSPAGWTWICEMPLTNKLNSLAEFSGLESAVSKR